MDFTDVVLTKVGNIAVIKLNRPKAFNSLGFLEEIIESLEICSDDKEVRAIILTGEGKAFCSGGDLTVAKQYHSESVTLFRQLTKPLNRVIKELRTIPKPIVAAINGATGGAGLSLAAACDLRIAAASSKFRQSYTTVGLVSDGGWSLTIPMLVGFAKAAEMVFLDPSSGEGNRINSQDC
ncbi:enoyl-CoA hydratase/isomerase family protein [Dehalobacter sp.]|uniref:enoyl-CoA hydratase/isomerase family protein n=1 Tax=Dehalobacter sp. TaxID=1962289 RepID=UPI00258DA191|nr:enoyl-CoA hydratase/isomerase family protein [Dehalobacter sp.]MDJ0306648.1 enoyl-CoA hydratase/isomerase family protein [Dehalobacter sp.]